MTRGPWREWKARIRIDQILADIGLLSEFCVSGRRLVGPCPVHDGDNRRAFSVDRDRNLWFCFTRCQAGGDVVDLAWRLSGQSWGRTASWLERLATSSARAPEFDRARGEVPPATRAFRPFQQRLPLQGNHPFFRRLEIDDATLRRFEAGAWAGGGFLSGTVAVRLHDLQGNPLGYAGRRLDPEDIRRWGKWKWPPRFPKAQLLWNWHRVDAHTDAGLIVVEGPWSVMKLWQAGFERAVAIGGAYISPAQAALLAHASTVTLLFDGDATGRQATARSLASKFHPGLRAIPLPDGTDPAELTVDQLKQLLKRT